MSEVAYHFFVGVDWGTEMHQICVLNRDGRIIEERKVPHSATTVMDFIDWLSGIVTAPSATAIAIEIPHGALVEELLERGFCVFSITRNNSIDSAIDISRPAQRMIGKMLSSWQMLCGQTGIVFERFE